jgi:DNA repair exonuclease SbcCD ATPase subunit
LFDRLVGKKELEERIRSLEKQLEQIRYEKESLAAQLASKEETARKAVSRKQTVEEELNTEKKKIETLEHLVSTLHKDLIKEVTFRNISTLSRPSLDRYIFQIGSVRTHDDSLLTVYMPPNESLAGLENNHKLQEYLGSDTAGLIDKINSPTGAVIFYDTNRMIKEVVLPFLPVSSSSWQINTRFNTIPIQQLMEKQVNLCIAIVHAGESFIGITKNPKSFLDHRIIHSSVKGKHTKGGWSQRRFERLREEDIQHHLEKVKSALGEFINRSNEDIDYVIAGGETNLVSVIVKNIHYPVLERTFDVSADKKNIDKILKDVWSSKRFEI